VAKCPVVHTYFTSAALQRTARIERICSISRLWCHTDRNFSALLLMPVHAMVWAPTLYGNCMFLCSLSCSHELDLLLQGRTRG